MTTSQQPSGEQKTAPYMSFARFESFIGGLHGKPLPPRIDRTIIQKMSGGEQSALRITNRFLGLIEGDDNKVTERLRNLVANYSTDSWKDALGDAVKAAYAHIMKDLDANATMGQLMEHFRERGGVQGSALSKAVRFYTSAAAAGGIEVSAHIKGSSAAAPDANGDRPKRARRAPREHAAGETGTKVVQPPEGIDLVVVPIPGKDVRVWLPVSLTQPEFDFLISTLKTWRKLKSG